MSRQPSNSADAAAAPEVQLHDCWNSIGVRGDGSCAELQRHVHCRNCPVFAAAASELLDGGLPEGYVSGWTLHFAQPSREDQAHTHSALIFRVGNEWLALSTRLFEEVADLRPVHTLPGRRNGIVRGLVNVRGELLVCVALDRLLGLHAAAPERQHAVAARLLVLRHKQARTVFAADEVHGIHRFHARELKEPPATVTHADHRYTQALLTWNGQSVGLLDDELLCHAINRSLSSAALT